MKNKLKDYYYQKKLAFFSMLAFFSTAPMFAQTVPGLGGIEKLTTSIMNIFTSDITKAILIMCLCGCAIAYGFNKDNEKMKRNIIAIAIAIAILVGAQALVGWIWSSAQTK